MINQLILNDPVGRLLQLMEAAASKRIVMGVVVAQTHKFADRLIH